MFLLDPPNLVEHYDKHCEGLTGAEGAASAVAVMELPGFGFSYPKRGFGWRLEDYVEAVEVALDALFQPQEFRAGIVLVAPCVCVYIALRLAAQRPERIVKLVLAQAPCWQEECAWAALLDWHPPIVARPYVGQVAMMLGARGAALRWYRAAAGERAAVPRLTKTMDKGRGPRCVLLFGVLRATIVRPQSSCPRDCSRAAADPVSLGRAGPLAPPEHPTFGPGSIHARRCVGTAG